ncbi:MAG: YhdT family protein [Berryella intestinalis]|uniref:YhdT family protein n=1 Tax=Berryella intestinalis TaxID=1531429 RepID=UPI002A57730B|nr:YhdT family protein [Berryella intestinalis]MDD7369386.1 YhdT family protein [Berryella intestinalis]MDY3128779.1 YhdT family protein [Berryella intestinalis]
MEDRVTYRDKLKQADREARATVVALAVTIVVWAVGGFGLAGLDIKVAHTPLWVICGTVGAWICAIACAVYLDKRVFVDFSLDDEDGCRASGPDGSIEVSDEEGKNRG